MRRPGCGIERTGQLVDLPASRNPATQQRLAVGIAKQHFALLDWLWSIGAADQQLQAAGELRFGGGIERRRGRDQQRAVVGNRSAGRRFVDGDHRHPPRARLQPARGQR